MEEKRVGNNAGPQTKKDNLQKQVIIFSVIVQILILFGAPSALDALSKGSATVADVSYLVLPPLGWLGVVILVSNNRSKTIAPIWVGQLLAFFPIIILGIGAVVLLFYYFLIKY